MRPGSAAGSGSAVLSAELVDATGRIHDLLRTRIKRMAGRTDIDVQLVGQRRLGIELVTATADNLDFAVLGMNVGLHDSVDLLKIVLVAARLPLDGTSDGLRNRCIDPGPAPEGAEE